MSPVQSHGKSLLYVRFLFAAFLHQIDQHFRVRIGIEAVPLGKKLILDFKIVFDNAVMNNGKRFVIA